MSKEFERVLHWFRRDLRIADNVALKNACDRAKEVFPIFIFDQNILEKLDNEEDRRISFIFEGIEELKQELETKGSSLAVFYGRPESIIPEIVRKWNLQAVFVNKDYDAYSKKRDHQIKKELTAQDVQFLSYKDSVIFEQDEVLTKSNTAFKVFSPYKNAWRNKITESDYKEHKPNLKSLARKDEFQMNLKIPSREEMGFCVMDNLIQGGRKAGLKKCKEFLDKISNYNHDRNFPSLNATSFLSAYLRFGFVCPRELLRATYSNQDEGSISWVNELIWRDFYHMILDQFPHVARSAFNEKYKDLKWEGKEAHFQAWCEGQTGYPIIDAAMRYFVATGWMHNRLRMIVAMFLTKDLLIHWKKGEAFFARYLLDYDKAANNGGWQWSASTGCDAQPYFRVFNPTLQSKKFDPEGEFIRKNLPELEGFPDKYIHEPYLAPIGIQKLAGCIVGKDYPEPIVDHKVQKLKAIAMFKD